MTFTPVMYYKGGRSIFATTRAEAVDLEYNGWLRNPTATPPPADPPPGGGTGGTGTGLVLGTTADTAKRGDYVPSWLEITAKPSTFPPEAHAHAVNALSDASAVGRSILTATSASMIRALLGVDAAGTSNLELGTTALTAKRGDYVPTWTEVTGKPTTFAPVVGTTAATAKAGNYVPAWTEVTGKPTTFAPATHTHTAANITDLADVLRGTDCVIMYSGTQPLRTTGTTDTARRVRWVSATAPSIAAGYAIDGLDVWERTV